MTWCRLRRLRPVPSGLSLALGAALAFVAIADDVRAVDADGVRSTVERVDALMTSHWTANGVPTAAACDDATFLRRVTLDLIGRIPTVDELDAFLKDGAADKRSKRIDALVAGPEFPLFWGAQLDEFIQGTHAGNEAFIDYLRRSLREGKGWDSVFRELMVGPWTADSQKPAARFLEIRAKQLDQLTVDATRAFFGVDVSCAQCHDHPLVDAWKQDHFYGMASFFNRTTGGKGTVGEKSDGEVTFVSKGTSKTSPVMFLSGRIMTSPATADGQKPTGRRALLVQAALDEPTFFRRAFVNRMWEQFFGRGLVDPVDQMHAANAPSVPGVLEFLADDFATHQYDVARLLTVIVRTKAWQAASIWTDGTTVPSAGHFAVARLRPLNRRQIASSLLLATGNVRLGPPNDDDRRLQGYLQVEGLTRIRQRLDLERRAENFIARFDPRTRDFQSSTAEALSFSNASDLQELFQPKNDNLTAALAALRTDDERIEAAVRQVLGRPVRSEERGDLQALLERGSEGSRSGLLVWALCGSAEFRFNH